MLKNYRYRTHAIIIILVVFFSIPIKGIAQTEDNKIGSKKQNTKNQLSPKILPKKVNKIIESTFHLSNPTKSTKKINPLLKKIPIKKIEILKNKIPSLKKNIKIKKLSLGSISFSEKIKVLERNLFLTKTLLVTAKKSATQKGIEIKKLKYESAKFPGKIKVLEKKLSLAKTQLATAKKSQTQKVIEIKKLKSESAKFPGKIKALEENLSLAKNELEGLKKNDSKKSEEINKLNEDINYLLESIDEQKAELAELSIQSSMSGKYKEMVKCYRAALFTWNNLVSRQGLNEKEYLVVTVELRKSLFACPPI